MTSSTNDFTPFQQMIVDFQQQKIEQSDFIAEFLNTKFYVEIHKQALENEKESFNYHVYDSQQNPDGQTIVISENDKYLQTIGNESQLYMKGGDIIKTIHPNLEISIVFDGGGIGLPVAMVDWLKSAVKIK